MAYYRGDPLRGGQLLGTRTVTPGPSERPFQDALGGATHAVTTTPLGKRVVDLRDARGLPGTGPDGAPPPGQPGVPGGDPGPLGEALRGASRVTFYSADPLQGGQATGTLTLGGASAGRETAVTRAARRARFAVVERPGERLIVDLGAGR